MKKGSFLMMSCHDATEAVEKDIHKSLSLWQKFKLNLHLSLCKVCAFYAKQSRILEQVLKKFHSKVIEPSPEELANLEIRIKEQLEKEEQ